MKKKTRSKSEEKTWKAKAARRNRVLMVGIPVLLVVVVAAYWVLRDDGRLRVRIGESVFVLEVARDDAARQKGLMNRTWLDADAGMVFIYPADRRRSFWMRNTTIPLTIAFLDDKGVIEELYDMEPLSETPVMSKNRGRFAIELNRGAFARAGAQPGDMVQSLSPAHRYGIPF